MKFCPTCKTPKACQAAKACAKTAPAKKPADKAAAYDMKMAPRTRAKVL